VRRHGWVLAGVVALLLAGCGAAVTREQQAQQDALRYEQQIGQINTAAAQPAASPLQTRDRLDTAVRAYARLHPPALLRSLHRQLRRAFRDELHSVRTGLRATAAGDGRRIRTAQAQNAQARAAVTRALRRVAARIGRCRASLAACLPPASGAGA
jgi:hypothetical protein